MASRSPTTTTTASVARHSHSHKSAALEALAEVQAELRALEVQLEAATASSLPTPGTATSQLHLAQQKAAAAVVRSRLARAQAHVREGATRLRNTVSTVPISAETTEWPGGGDGGSDHSLPGRPMASERVLQGRTVAPAPRPGDDSPGEAFLRKREADLVARAPSSEAGRRLVQNRFRLPSMAGATERLPRLYGGKGGSATWRTAAIDAPGEGSRMPTERLPPLTKQAHRVTFITEGVTPSSERRGRERGDGAGRRGEDSAPSAAEAGDATPPLLDMPETLRIFVRRGQLQYSNDAAAAEWRACENESYQARIQAILDAAVALAGSWNLSALELLPNEIERLARLETTRRAPMPPAHAFACVRRTPSLLAALQHPANRYRGNAGEGRAATRLQRAWRRILADRTAAGRLQQSMAAATIWRAWILYMRRAQMRRRIEERRARLASVQLALQQHLSAIWPGIGHRGHVVVHLPSLGFDALTHRLWKHTHSYQLRQIGRIFQCVAPNTKVVLVWPEPWDDAMECHFHSWLGRATGLSPEVAARRLEVVVPEHAAFFQPLNFSLARTLLYRCVSSFVAGDLKFLAKMGGVPSNIKLGLFARAPLLRSTFALHALPCR
jgi:hypothetical protein